MEERRRNSPTMRGQKPSEVWRVESQRRGSRTRRFPGICPDVHFACSWDSFHRPSVQRVRQSRGSQAQAVKPTRLTHPGAFRRNRASGVRACRSPSISPSLRPGPGEAARQAACRWGSIEKGERSDRTTTRYSPTPGPSPATALGVFGNTVRAGEGGCVGLRLAHGMLAVGALCLPSKNDSSSSRGNCCC